MQYVLLCTSNSKGFTKTQYVSPFSTFEAIFFWFCFFNIYYYFLKFLELTPRGLEMATELICVFHLRSSVFETVIINI